MPVRFLFLAHVFGGLEVLECMTSCSPGHPVLRPKSWQNCSSQHRSIRGCGVALVSGTFFQIFKTAGQLLYIKAFWREYLANHKSFTYHC